MANKTAALSDEEKLYSQLSDYLDDSLSNELRKNFDETAKKLGLEGVATDFGIKRGRLQIEAQRLYLNEKDLRDIHDLVEDDAARANHEAKDIEDVGRSELKGNSLRLVLLLVLFGAIAYGLFHFFGPKAKVPFKALDSLAYEALVMIEDPEGRLDFPTDKLSEVNNYFIHYPDLGFAAKPLQEAGEGWEVNGGTVIDYDVAKVLSVQFNNTGTQEKLFLFLYKGQLDQLPASTPSNFQGILYQTYASDRLNMVAWQATPDTMGMMVGYRGAKDLAELAFKIIGP